MQRTKTSLTAYAGLAMLLLMLLPAIVRADVPRVIDAKAECDKARRCSFSVSVLHADEGWEHYVDRWELFTAAGESLGVRTLYHPHVNEQPFTRSLGRVKIPDGVESILIEAHDSRHGNAPSRYQVKLPK